MSCPLSEKKTFTQKVWTNWKIDLYLQTVHDFYSLKNCTNVFWKRRKNATQSFEKRMKNDRITVCFFEYVYFGRNVKLSGSKMRTNSCFFLCFVLYTACSEWVIQYAACCYSDKYSGCYRCVLFNEWPIVFQSLYSVIWYSSWVYCTQMFSLFCFFYTNGWLYSLLFRLCILSGIDSVFLNENIYEYDWLSYSV